MKTLDFQKTMAFQLVVILFLSATRVNGSSSFPQVRKDELKLAEITVIPLFKTFNEGGKQLPPVADGVSVSGKPFVKAGEIADRVIGEEVAAKIFGNSGREVFRIGWKAGKKLLAGANKSEKYKDSVPPRCSSPSFSCTQY